MGFIATPNLAALVKDTGKVADIDVSRFDSIVIAGEQAPMFNFEGATGLQQKFSEFYESGKIAAALSHGVAHPALRQAQRRRIDRQGARR